MTGLLIARAFGKIVAPDNIAGDFFHGLNRYTKISKKHTLDGLG